MKEFIEKIDRRILTNDEIMMMNALKLAYIGDAVYETYIRAYVLHNYRFNVNQTNKKAISFVNASSQARIVEYLKPYLTDYELSVVRRGRNQKSSTPPKNANKADYKLATGFEALIGMLYLKNDESRIRELIIHGIEFLDPEVKDEK